MKHTIATALLCLGLAACSRSGDDDGGDNGGSDGGDDGSGDTIQEVQNDAMPVGTAVTLKGVVISAIDLYGSRKGGVYLQEPEGGEYSGVFLYLSGTEAADLEVGDLVDVSGVTKDEFVYQGTGGCPDQEESGTLTELEPGEGTTVSIAKSGDGTVPTPPVLNPWDLAASEAEAEKWEGVPITFENVRVQSNPYAGGSDDTLEEMRVTGPFSVESSLTAFGDAVAVGDCYASITGVVDWFYDYSVLPRTAADLVAGEDGDCLPVENTAELCGDTADNDYSGHGDCADFGCQAAVADCVVAATVAEIQGGDIEENTRVSLADVVVLGRSFNGKRLWVSDDVTTSGPETAVYVYQPTDSDAFDASVTVGKTVAIEANVDEVYSGCTNNPFTELTFVADGVMGTGGGGDPDPLTGVPLATLVSDTDGEPYEGTLVTIANLTVEEIVEDINVNLAFKVGDGTSSIVVDDDIFRYADVEVGQCLTITGIMSYDTFDAFTTVLPRSSAEVVITDGCP
jgi:hypothetical protein